MSEIICPVMGDQCRRSHLAILEKQVADYTKEIVRLTKIEALYLAEADWSEVMYLESKPEVTE